MKTHPSCLGGQCSEDPMNYSYTKLTRRKTFPSRSIANWKYAPFPNAAIWIVRCIRSSIKTRPNASVIIDRSDAPSSKSIVIPIKGMTQCSAHTTPLDHNTNKGIVDPYVSILHLLEHHAVVFEDLPLKDLQVRCDLIAAYPLAEVAAEKLR